MAGCADVSHPARAGLSQVFSVFISLCICLATSLMILVTESYSVVSSDGSYVVQHIQGGYDVFVTESVISWVIAACLARLYWSDRFCSISFALVVAESIADILACCSLQNDSTIAP